MAHDSLPTTTAPLLVIANPRAGRGRGVRRADELARELRRRSAPFTMLMTERPGHATALAAESSGPVVVVGGDGTVHEVLNGLRPRGGRLGPLAVLPTGNGDDFAANAGCPPGAATLVECLGGSPRTVDVGEAAIECERGFVRRRFANFLGIGFLAQVAGAAERLRPLRGRLLYLASALRALRAQRCFDCEFGGDGFAERLPVLLASVCNGARVGGGLLVAPEARPDDGLFDVLRVAACSRWSTLALLLRLLRGTHLADRRVRLHRCRGLTLRSAAGVPVAMDGESVAAAATSIVVAMAPEPLLVFGR